MKKNILIIFITFTFFLAKGQNSHNSKIVNSKKDYKHKISKIVFPTKIENYLRKNIFIYDKKKKNISATYENETSSISVYIYPAGNGTDGRLRREYLKSISFFKNKNLDYTQKPIKYYGKYIVNGYKADFKNKNYLQLSIYECGTWFLKFTVTFKTSDTLGFKKVEKKFIKQFNPSNLTGIKSLNKKVDIKLRKLAFRDSTMLGSNLASAYGKFDWVMDNTKENERASGFPDLYLEANIVQVKEFLNFDKKWNLSKKKETKEYLNELKKIVNSNFLNEYIMEQKKMIMIVPKNIKLDFEAYNKWKKENNFKIELSEFHYTISFNEN